MWKERTTIKLLRSLALLSLLLAMVGCIYVEIGPDHGDLTVVLLSPEGEIRIPLINGIPLTDYRGFNNAQQYFIDFRYTETTGLSEVRYEVESIEIKLKGRREKDTIYFPTDGVASTGYWYPGCTAVQKGQQLYVPPPYTLAGYLRVCNNNPDISKFQTDGLSETSGTLSVTARSDRVRVGFELPALDAEDQAGWYYRCETIPFSGIIDERFRKGEEHVLWPQVVDSPGRYWFQLFNARDQRVGDRFSRTVDADWFWIDGVFDLSRVGGNR